MATLHIVRGLPGSGKSTFAKKLSAQLGCRHFEADMFFTDEQGNYNFDREKLGDAHEWCRDSVVEQIKQGKDVVVSNTFTTSREIMAYLRDQQPFLDVVWFDPTNQVIVYEMTGEYGSVHDVPVEALQRMKNRWVSNAELDALITCGEIRCDHDIEFRTIEP
jgi:adenylate kinase family enzyme